MDLERRVSSQWVSGPLRCEVRTEGGFVVAVDEPVSAGGTDSGPQPTDLFLSSVASCFTLALAYAAAKHNLEPTSIEVDVLGHYDGPRFDRVEITATVAGIASDRLERIIALAEKLCYVTNSLRRPPSVSVSVATAGG